MSGQESEPWMVVNAPSAWPTGPQTKKCSSKSPKPKSKPDHPAKTPAITFANKSVGWKTNKAGSESPKKKKGDDKSSSNEEDSSNNLYKTELCRSFIDTGTCRYGQKCQFAHGVPELRPVLRHPKYKTEICNKFTSTGACPYGSRFIHPGTSGSPPSVWSSAWTSDEELASSPPSANQREQSDGLMRRLAFFQSLADVSEQ